MPSRQGNPGTFCVWARIPGIRLGFSFHFAASSHFISTAGLITEMKSMLRSISSARYMCVPDQSGKGSEADIEWQMQVMPEAWSKLAIAQPAVLWQVHEMQMVCSAQA